MEVDWEQTCSFYLRGLNLFVNHNPLGFAKMIWDDKIDSQGKCPTDKVFWIFVCLGKASAKQKKGNKK